MISCVSEKKQTKTCLSTNGHNNAVTQKFHVYFMFSVACHEKEQKTSSLQRQVLRVSSSKPLNPWKLSALSAAGHSMTQAQGQPGTAEPSANPTPRFGLSNKMSNKISNKLSNPTSNVSRQVCTACFDTFSNVFETKASLHSSRVSSYLKGFMYVGFDKKNDVLVQRLFQTSTWQNGKSACMFAAL